jgi:hypothetical protein
MEWARRVQRCRRARLSPNAAGQKKGIPIVSPVTAVPRQRSLAPALGEPVRNSAGVTVARTTSGPVKTDSIHTIPSLPVGMGMSMTRVTAPVTGINGTNMGHAGGRGIGGPAKAISGINGSAFGHKF